MWEAEQSACRRMDEQDQQLRRASLVGMGHSVRGVSPWSAQSRFVSAALQGSVEEVERMLRESSAADVNPLVSLHSAGLPHHRGVAHWPLRALLAASFELSSDSGLKEKLRVIRQVLMEWEGKLAQLFHHAVVMLGSGQRERLKLLLREIRWCKGTQFNLHAILEGVWQARATRDGELRWIYPGTGTRWLQNHRKYRGTGIRRLQNPSAAAKPRKHRGTGIRRLQNHRKYRGAVVLEFGLLSSRYRPAILDLVSHRHHPRH